MAPTDLSPKFPGYHSSTQVELKLKELAKLVDSGEKPKAKSMQVRGTQVEEDYVVANGCTDRFRL
jgi:hypothetical protein